jgi:hypothetical protein
MTNNPDMTNPDMTDSPDMTGDPASAFDVNKAAADLSQALKDGVYVAIGLGVLGFQRAQVRRLELTRQLEGWMGQRGETGGIPEAGGGPTTGSELTAHLTELAGRVDEALAPARELGRQFLAADPATVEAHLETARTQLTELARAVDERVKPVRRHFDEQFDLIEAYLPEATRSLLQALRAAAVEPEQRLRHAVGLD